MTQHVDSWLASARRLGVEVTGPFPVTLPDGRRLEAKMHVPNFGAENGTLVFSELSRLNDYEQVLAIGYSYSVFDEPPEGYVTPEQDMVEILRNWGWNGADERRPQWMA